jgi:hypothetical protein
MLYIHVLLDLYSTPVSVFALSALVIIRTFCLGRSSAKAPASIGLCRARLEFKLRGLVRATLLWPQREAMW